MAIENIDGTVSGDGPYNTSIPGLADNADIQEALRIYHYGTKNPPANISEVTSKSIAGYFNSLSGRLSTVEGLGIGSSYRSTEPTPVPDGFVWVDSDSASPIYDSMLASIPSVARYQTSQPTSNIADGMIWVDKDDVHLTTYVYDQGLTSWVKINESAKYQNNPPTGNITEGSLWVDKDSSPLMLYVFDSSLGWRPIGV
jgi:hypothetical protein